MGLKLAVTPQINVGGVIKLKIKLESSSVASDTGSVGTASLVTNKRTINNTVNVASGQVLVIGGLTDDNSNESKSQVPLLGSIPVIGELFKSRNVSRTKRNLMVFIHPTVLRTQSEGDFYTRRKYDSVRNVQLLGAAKGKLPLGVGDRLLMPELEAYIRANTNPAAPPRAAEEPRTSAPADAPPPPRYAEPAPAPERSIDRSNLPKNVFVIPAERPSGQSGTETP